MADEVHFINFVNNLLDNALKYSKDHPVIKLSTSNVGNNIKIKIEDNGIGRKHAQEIKERQLISNASFATIATEKRIELLNQYNLSNYTFELIDLYENDVPSGTRVVIILPIT